jgi:predicted aspartyl protease
MRRAVTWLLGCLVIGFAPLEAGDGGDRVTPFERSPHGGVVVKVLLDGHGPFRLIVDTGSTHSVITARVAAAIGARAVAQAELSTTAGSQVLPVTSVGCLQVGPVAVPILPSVVDDLPVPGEADGLMGLDVLAGRHFTIDYRHRQIVWHESGMSSGSAGPSPVDLHTIDGRLVVDAIVDGRTMPLVVDSASETLVLFGGVPVRRGVEAPAELGTLVDRRPVSVGVIATLRVGVAEQRQIRAVHLDRPPAPGGPAGLLPIHGFTRVTIDGPRRRLTVWR